MNHRATSACNCISVPIINVSTAVLFTKAVIIKSQVGEIWNTNAYLKKPFLCNSVSKYSKTKFAVVDELSWVYFWNSVLNRFWAVWFPVKALSVPHGFLSIFWNPKRSKGVKLFIFPLQTYHLNLESTVNKGEKKVCIFFLVKNVYFQSSQLELQISLIHPSPTILCSPPRDFGLYTACKVPGQFKIIHNQCRKA